MTGEKFSKSCEVLCVILSLKKTTKFYIYSSKIMIIMYEMNKINSLKSKYIKKCFVFYKSMIKVRMRGNYHCFQNWNLITFRRKKSNTKDNVFSASGLCRDIILLIIFLNFSTRTACELKFNNLKAEGRFPPLRKCCWLIKQLLFQESDWLKIP